MSTPPAPTKMKTPTGAVPSTIPSVSINKIVLPQYEVLTSTH